MQKRMHPKRIGSCVEVVNAKIYTFGVIFIAQSKMKIHVNHSGAFCNYFSAVDTVFARAL